MKLCPEMVGKRIRMKDWAQGSYVDVEWQRGNDAAGISYFGETWYFHEGNRYDWEIIEKPAPEQLPSKRITELYFNLKKDHSCHYPCIICVSYSLEATQIYLDEQHKKKEASQLKD